jgi:hypothetical protein|tara:strand:- start:2507 stop:2908 length:402 start_codon:yes stop_codon:yes gene_type:complete
MPKNKYTEKQMKIARVAEPRDAITGADFEAMNNSKMGGGMIKYAEGGDIRKEMLMQMLEDARENNDDDKIIEIEAELFQMGDGQGMMGGGMVKRPGYKHGGKVKGYRDGMSVNASKGKGCGIATSGRGYSGTY